MIILNENLTVDLNDQTAYEDNLFTLDIAADTFVDDEDSSLTYSALEQGQAILPGWLSFNSTTRQFSGTPAQSDIGTYTIELTAEDSGGLTISDTFDIAVVNTNDAPTVDNPIPDRSATEDAAFTYQFALNVFSDIDPADSLTYSAVESGQLSMPSWLNFNPTTRVFSGTPGNDEVGEWDISVTAEDQSGATATDEFTITVSNMNDGPTVENPIPDQGATEDVLFTYQFAVNVFGDIDVGDSLTYNAVESGQTSMPSWLSFNPDTRTFSGTPGNDEVGTWTIRVTAEDQTGAAIHDEFDVVVSNVNNAPTVANPVPDQDAYEDALFSYQFPLSTFDDIDDGDSLTYSAAENGQASLPGWLSFDADTRTFSGNPTQAELGSYTIDLTAQDLSGVSVTDTFVITVNNTNDAPTVANPIPDRIASEGALFTYQFAADVFADVDPADTLSYSAVESGQTDLPDWLSFDAGNRTFSGTPQNVDVGTFVIDVTAQDLAGATVTDTFEITVDNVNNPPTLQNPIPDQNATEDVPFTFQFAADTFDDIDVGDSLTYSAVETSLSALPAWLSFNSGTRSFSGTPDNNDVGTWSITVTAADLIGAEATDTFEIVVGNVNDAPTLDQGIPDQNAYEDSEFNFPIPSDAFADDDVGDSLTYSVVGDGTIAAWLCYDEQNTSLCGTPLDAHIGTDFVHVTATDGSGASVTADFRINVLPVNDAPIVEHPIITVVPEINRQTLEDAYFSP